MVRCTCSKRMRIPTSKRLRTWPSRRAPRGCLTMSCSRRSWDWVCHTVRSGEISMVRLAGCFGILRPRLRARFAVGSIAAVALLCSCADQQKMHEMELTELLVSLPGHYDNTAQVQADAQRGLHPPHDPLALVIVPVDDVLIGDHVFYVQEMAADDPRRVMAQRVWTFGVENKTIVQSVWTLKEPLRWRDAQNDPAVLHGMVNEDVSPVRGC